MDTISTLLAFCENNPQLTGGFPSQRASKVELIFFYENAAITENVYKIDIIMYNFRHIS